MLDQIQQIIKTAVKSKFNLDIVVETQFADGQFGDFSTNAPFLLAKELKKSPAQIAAQLAETIKDKDVAKAEAAGAGYVNITMKPGFWVAELAKIDAKYGHSQHGQGEKVQVEFISANPTGPLTLGNARGGFIGDVLSNVLASQGYHVTREYYFNDAGTQISNLVASIKGEGQEYKGEYIDQLREEFQGQLGDKDVAQKLTKAIFDRYIQPAIHKMGIKYDEWFNERSLAEGGEFAAAVARLEALGLIYEQDGAKWLRSTNLGDQQDRVLVKSNGDTTYLGNDIPYHLNIFEKRGFSRAIKVWGADHVGQVQSLQLTINKLLPDKQLDFVIVQWVRLVKDGQEVKMSKRAGTYVTVEELIDEVGAEVARFFFLLRSADAQMEFDLGLAKQQSAKNPLWYVMYSYARAHSILAQAKDKDLQPANSIADLSQPEVELIKQMAKLPLILQQTSGDYGVHRLAFYGQELAKLFHDYYESERIIKLPKEQAEGKLYLVKQYIVLLDNYWQLLGIKPQTKM